jgi:predicted nicotinamide N-methyase
MRNLPPDVLTRRVRFQQLDWRTPGDLEKVDLVIAADVAYERRNFSPLLSLIGQVVHPGGVAIFADPDRSIGREFLVIARQQYDVTTQTRTATLNGITSTIVLAEIRPPIVSHT